MERSGRIQSSSKRHDLRLTVQIEIGKFLRFQNRISIRILEDDIYGETAFWKTHDLSGLKESGESGYKKLGEVVAVIFRESQTEASSEGIHKLRVDGLVGLNIASHEKKTDSRILRVPHLEAESVVGLYHLYERRKRGVRRKSHIAIRSLDERLILRIL